jgi:hypothetical protein
MTPLSTMRDFLTNFMNLKIKLNQSFKYAHKDKLCICIFIEMNDHILYDIKKYCMTGCRAGEGLKLDPQSVVFCTRPVFSVRNMLQLARRARNFPTGSLGGQHRQRNRLT